MSSDRRSSSASSPASKNWIADEYIVNTPTVRPRAFSG